MLAPSGRRWSMSVGKENKELPSGKRLVTTRSHSFRPTMSPQKVVSTPYRLLDADPHASRVISYMRPSDYAVWGGATAAAPAALYLWGEHLEITRNADRRTDHRVMRY